MTDQPDGNAPVIVSGFGQDEYTAGVNEGDKLVTMVGPPAGGFVSTAADKRVPKASATGAVNYVGTGTGLSVQRGRQLWQRIDGVLVRRTVHRKVSP